MKPAVFKAQGGNRRIHEGMAKRLKDAVRLGEQVTAVVSDAAGVTVHTRGGGRYTARAAICALPFAALRHLRFDPPLAGRVFAIPRSPADDEVVSLLVTAYGKKSTALDRMGPEGAARHVIA